MNRQQAPQPVVRPLPILGTAEDARGYVLSQPVIEGRLHIANFIVDSNLIEVGGVDIPPLMKVIIDGDTISGYLQGCDEDSAQVHFIDCSNVTTQVLCDDLPCTVGTADRDKTLAYVREVIYTLAGDNYRVGEFLYEKRSYIQGARVDAILEI